MGEVRKMTMVQRGVCTPRGVMTPGCSGYWALTVGVTLLLVTLCTPGVSAQSGDVGSLVTDGDKILMADAAGGSEKKLPEELPPAVAKPESDVGNKESPETARITKNGIGVTDSQPTPTAMAYSTVVTDTPSPQPPPGPTVPPGVATETPGPAKKDTATVGANEVAPDAAKKKGKPDATKDDAVTSPPTEVNAGGEGTPLGVKNDTDVAAGNSSKSAVLIDKDGQPKSNATTEGDSIREVDGKGLVTPVIGQDVPLAGAGPVTTVVVSPVDPDATHTTIAPPIAVATEGPSDTTTTSTPGLLPPLVVPTEVITQETPVPPAGGLERPNNVTAVPDPPYGHVTTAVPRASVPSNESLKVMPPAASTAFTPKLISIIVGAAAGGLAILALIVVLIVIVRRQRRKDRCLYVVNVGHDIPIVENPRYVSAATKQGHNYRFSRDASLMIGAPNLVRSNGTTLKIYANNNHNEKSNMNSLRKKRKAPQAPNPFTEEMGTPTFRQNSTQYYEKFPKSKRKAPAAPNPFTTDTRAVPNPYSIEFYEQDTPVGSEVELTTFGIKPQLEGDGTGGSAAEIGASGATESDFSHTDDDDDDDSSRDVDLHQSAEELEGHSLLQDIEKDTGYRIAPKNGPVSKNRRSVADKYAYSDDEEALNARDYDRNRFSSEEELDAHRSYDSNDVTEGLMASDQSKDEASFDSSRN